MSQSDTFHCLNISDAEFMVCLVQLCCLTCLPSSCQMALLRPGVYLGHMQAEMLTTTAMKAGFSGGLVVDFPHSTRAKKYFLVLMVGSSSYQPQARGLDGEDSDEETQVIVQQRSQKRRKTANGNIQVWICASALTCTLPAHKLRHADACLFDMLPCDIFTYSALT